jgi:hypothetical protein
LATMLNMRTIGHARNDKALGLLPYEQNRLNRSSLGPKKNTGDLEQDRCEFAAL